MSSINKTTTKKRHLTNVYNVNDINKKFSPEKVGLYMHIKRFIDINVVQIEQSWTPNLMLKNSLFLFQAKKDTCSKLSIKSFHNKCCFRNISYYIQYWLLDKSLIRFSKLRYSSTNIRFQWHHSRRHSFYISRQCYCSLW